ncbi:MAG: response regulator, partial [Cyanobacteria bacterium]|nr:response regulator [Cyanobacteriota bacterium]
MTVNTESNFVLLVDDNPSNLSVLSEVLTIAGIAFRVALDGKSALALADRKLPSLILLDIQMPGIDGFEVCRQLQQNPKTQAIPIIFMTAVTEVESKAQGFALGAVDYITKPFQKVEILARVKAHLRLHHLNQDLQQELKLRQQAEIKLRKSEQRYRYLYENTPVTGLFHSKEMLEGFQPKFAAPLGL